jgi:putative oxidoreductase
MRVITTKVVPLYNNAVSAVELLQPLALLGARLYVSWVFFAAGLTKLRDWESTLFLFEEEYAVPLLNPEFAAYLATFGEVFLPILLVLGFASRFGAIGLGIVNVVAVISLEDIAPAALSGHVIWGLLLLLTTLWGAGQLSLDNLFKSKYSAAVSR